MSATKKLWEVKPEDTSVAGHLWIIAQTIAVATNKGQRWLKKNGYKIAIKKVEFHGTVDVL